MKVSESWLSDWVNTPLKSKALADKLTMAGLEVDEILPASGDFQHVIVAHVVDTAAHPKADRLTVCSVNTGASQPTQIVCGAANVRANLKIALAVPGARLPGGIEIKSTALRGVPSEGMICSSSELGLEESSEGILELPADAPVGMPLEDYLKLDDQVLMIELTPNRADCFSMRGIAREVSVLTGCDFNPPKVTPVEAAIKDEQKIQLDATEACKGYALRLIKGIDPHAETPLWMKERLRRAGVRPIRPAVDVTQYVMLEFGQPMHAFDATKVSGDVHVRFSQEGEQLTLLDGQEITLDAGILLIADTNGPLALAGVMGGEASAVDFNTTDILLESAFFEPRFIAGVARRYGLCTDASQRFERGVDPALYPQMIERATALLLEIAGGKPGPVTMAHVPHHVPQKKITFDPAEVEALTGLCVPEAEMKKLLTSLGMKVAMTDDTTWQVEVPSYRFDVTLAVDLVEEIIRLHGYDKLKAETLQGTLSRSTPNAFYQTAEKASLGLMARGYHEIISYSFVDPRVQEALYPEKESLILLNPLSSELSVMRIGLWPGLVSALLHNVSRQEHVVKCFEVGMVFDVQDEAMHERAVVSGLMTGEQHALNWAEPARDYDFYDMKGDVEALFKDASAPLRFVPQRLDVLHPGKSACLYLGEQPVGWMGVLHPALAESFDLNHDVMLFEVSLDALTPEKSVAYQKISKYPKVRRDLSLLIDKKITAAQIESEVRKAVAQQSNALKAFYVFDQYMGEQVPEGKKSLAIALIFQETGRTLTEQDITPLMSHVIQKLEQNLAAQVRDGA